MTALQVSAKGRRFLNVYAQAQAFRRAIPVAEAAAAAVATDESKYTFLRQLNARNRPHAAPRTGRPTTGGTFDQLIRWRPDGRGNISFDFQSLKRAAPYFLIQEIGTGQTANILNPQGTVTVHSQIGRTISANLYWAGGSGGSAVGPRSGASGDQLYAAAELNASTLARVPHRRKRIRREIKGKHYIQSGGRAGYLQLRTRLTDEAKRIFK